MRVLAVLLTTLVVAACSTAPATRRDSPATSTSILADPQKASIEANVEFLLTAAATDFHTARPPDPVRFRKVRLGHLVASGGEKRYLLCGEFLPAPYEGEAEWMPFATIRTSGYEQWLGAQAVGYCEEAIWDDMGDLSSSLQSRLDSLR